MKNFRQLTLIALAAIGLTACSSDNAKALLDLTSTRNSMSINDNWTFKVANPTADDAKIAEWMPATVPGTVHTDLLDNGKIEDPYFSTNEKKQQWIGERDWIYQTTFTASEDLVNEQNQELVFKGLDTYAKVFLNDKLILEPINMFREWRVDVKDLLKAGENTLRIEFESAFNRGTLESKAYDFKLAATNDPGEIKTSVHVRKAPYHHGWDWGPRFITCGLFRPVAIESWNNAKIDNVHFAQKTQNNEVATFDANVTVVADKDQKATITVADDKAQSYATQTVELKKGENVVKVPFEIKNPKLWWPNGTGEANLYPTTVILAAEDASAKFDQTTTNVGIRTVKVIREKDAVGEGEGFHIEVNGEPIFARGANYIPLDVFLPEVSKDKYEEFIKVCVESNYNILRVWGGGVYEEDYFYELCDKYGLMVWQDFMFACSFYPWHDEFFENVKEEVIDNVERLRNHPSIALWCGNNEIYTMWFDWGIPKQYGWTKEQSEQVKDGMYALFDGLIPETLSTLDTSRYYHPSSPLFDGKKSVICADVHYWGVFHGSEPFSVYKDKPGRFSNEYGFQSLACYDTYREFFRPEEMKLYSEAMVVHQKNQHSYRIMDEYMYRDLPILKDDFRTYVYLTHILQAEGIKIAMEGHRQKRPYTMGSLYWQVNDCWPVASWASLDSEMRWKALQFYAKKSFAPTALSFEAIDSSKVVKLWGVTDELEAKKGTVKLSLMDFNGKVYSSQELEVNIPRNGNQEIIAKTADEFLAGNSPKEVMLVADGMVDGKAFRTIHYFTPFKDLKLPKADYEVKYTKTGDKEITAEITAKVLLKNLLFEAEAIQENPSDGYFDMLPNETKTVVLNFKDDVSVEDAGIFVTTLNALVGRPSLKPITKNIK